MAPETDVKLNAKVDAFQRFAEGKNFDSCRLVHYVGVNKPNAVDVHLSGVAGQVAACLAEGFIVDWLACENQLYLCVQEPGCPIPSWEKVIAEEALVDVEALLQEAGITGKS